MEVVVELVVVAGGVGSSSGGLGEEIVGLFE